MSLILISHIFPFYKEYNHVFNLIYNLKSRDNVSKNKIRKKKSKEKKYAYVESIKVTSVTIRSNLNIVKSSNFKILQRKVQIL